MPVYVLVLDSLMFVSLLFWTMFASKTKHKQQITIRIILTKFFWGYMELVWKEKTVYTAEISFSLQLKVLPWVVL